MFLLARPSAAAIDVVIVAQRDRTFSYAEVGASRGPAPAGYTVDHNRVLIGVGADAFARARRAVDQWAMFALDWCAIHPARAPIARGVDVAAVIRHFGFWSINVSRIVYRLDEDDGVVRRSGFAYGTLPEHGEIGEERFSVEWDRRDDRVHYDLYAFSKPGQLLARLGYPIGRMLQRRFGRDSRRAMVEAVRVDAG